MFFSLILLPHSLQEPKSRDNNFLYKKLFTAFEYPVAKLDDGGYDAPPKSNCFISKLKCDSSSSISRK